MFSDKRYLLITHTFATGLAQELRDFFIKNKVTFVFIEHPFSFNKREKRSKISYFQKGRSKVVYEGIGIKGPDILYFIKDFFYTLFFVIKLGKRCDICISTDPLNTSSAWILKKLGYFKGLVYYTVDYTPKRFENSLLNSIYHFLDRFHCYNSDLMWNSSKRMRGARKKNGVDLARCVEELIVPDGCHFSQIKRLPDNKVDRFKLVFMGHLIPHKGVDLVLRCLPPLIKEYPKVTLTVIGTGPEERKLKKLTKQLKIGKKVIFTGYIKDHQELEKMIASCGIAIAPYVPDPESFSFFSDVGKPKVYLACGLPVLINDVPEIARVIEKNKAGAIFEYHEKSLIKILKRLLANEKLYFQFRKNAIAMAKKLDWDSVFNKALDKTVRLLSI